MIKYSRTVEKHGVPVALYDVSYESGGIDFEVAFEVPLDEARIINDRFRLAFSQQAQQKRMLRLIYDLDRPGN